VRRKIHPCAVGVPPLPGGQPSAGEKTRVVRFAVSPATMIQFILVVACIWLLLRLWPVFLVLVVAEGGALRVLRQAGELQVGEPLTGEGALKLANRVIKILDVEEARQEVLPFLKDPRPLAVWSPEFFRDAFCRIAAAGEEEAIVG